MKEAFEKYKEESSKVNKEKDDFFSFMSGIKGNSEDSKFNTESSDLIGGDSNVKKGKEDFFKDFNKSTEPEQTIDESQINLDVKDINRSDLLSDKKKKFLNENY